MKALVTYGADVNAVNNLKESPRHLVANRNPFEAGILYALHAVGPVAARLLEKRKSALMVVKSMGK